MKKSLVLTGTIALLVFMIVLTTTQNTVFEPIMSNLPLHNVIRSVIVVCLLALAVTTQPRPRALRAALGIIAVIITVIALTQTINYALQILDALVYIASATVFMNEALESEPAAELEPAPLRRQKVRRRIA